MSPLPAPSFAWSARHNVRIVAAFPAESTPGLGGAAGVQGWTALVAERVGTDLAQRALEVIAASGGAGQSQVAPRGGEGEVALQASEAALTRLLVDLREDPSPGAGDLARAIEHAWTSYRQALADRRPTRVMGVVNVTPDSFNPVGRLPDPGAAADHALRLAAEGADILDIGGESTRPGASEVTAEEELSRVLPVVSRLAREVTVPISIDTTKPEVAARCLEAGARWVNDISGLTFDPTLAKVAADAGATLVLMHIRGTPRTMQQAPVYDDVVADTLRFLRTQALVALDAGLPFENLVIDPGFGFGKTVGHNLEILRRLREYTSAGAPLLVGASRKSTIGHVLGGLPSEERLEGTAATVAAAILNGAGIIRVHDVQAMRRVAQMTDAIRAGAGFTEAH